MHQPALGAKSPQWRGTEFIRGILRSVLDDSISCSHVMQQEVAEGMDDFAAQRLRDGESASIDGRSGRSSCDGTDVAQVAADGVKQSCALLRTRSAGQRCITGWDLGGAHEGSKFVYILEASCGIRFVFNIPHCVTEAGTVG